MPGSDAGRAKPSPSGAPRRVRDFSSKDPRSPPRPLLLLSCSTAPASRLACPGCPGPTGGDTPASWEAPAFCAASTALQLPAASPCSSPAWRGSGANAEEGMAATDPRAVGLHTRFMALSSPGPGECPSMLRRGGMGDVMRSPAVRLASRTLWSSSATSSVAAADRSGEGKAKLPACCSPASSLSRARRLPLLLSSRDCRSVIDVPSVCATECMDNLPRSGADVRMLLRDKEGGPGAASWVPPASASSAPWGIGPMFADWNEAERM
mmetsp:Transcript_9801/g.29467  ORF Transcript_9801/g.29467 Transcript_9801/m.29467 type:complete len:266 (+) Transcript_9801:52-849(+)